jgi:hypothetical protein
VTNRFAPPDAAKAVGARLLDTRVWQTVPTRSAALPGSGFWESLDRRLVSCTEPDIKFGGTNHGRSPPRTPADLQDG